MKRGLMALAALALLVSTASAQSAKGQTVPQPRMRTVQTDTTTVYDVTTTNKKGTTQYGMVEQTRSTPQGGTRVISQTQYSDYTPSKMALANEKHAEVSIGLGASYSFDKDKAGARMTELGLAATGQALWDISDHFALGADYMLLNHDSRTNHRQGTYKYDKLRLNSIALAGKYTINAWDTWRLYIPMGVGAAQARMKSSGVRNGEYTAQSSDKWGLDLFAGLGLQYNLSKDIFMGLEYRYTVAFVKADDLNRYYGKDNYLQFHSAFFRIGTRF